MLINKLEFLKIFLVWIVGDKIMLVICLISFFLLVNIILNMLWFNIIVIIELKGFLELNFI